MALLLWHITKSNVVVNMGSFLALSYAGNSKVNLWGAKRGHTYAQLCPVPGGSLNLLILL